jgi:hypothetical protein
VAVWVRVLCGFAGLFLQLVVLDAAIRTFLLPRVATVRLSRYTSRMIARAFRMIARRKSYVTKDEILAIYPSIVLLAYQVVWLSLSLVAFGGIYIASGVKTFSHAFALSGSSIIGAGIVADHSGSILAPQYVEAGLGLVLLALLIAFIPTLYQSFQRREYAVSRLTVRAGIPATPWGVLEIAASVDSY